jgi:hypothetical protein
MKYVPKHTPGKVYYVDCDICGHFHSEDWDGDCRDNTARYTVEELDAKHGANGWKLEVFDELELVPDEDEIELQAAA